MKQVSIFDIQLFDDFKQQDNLQYAYMNLEKVVSSVWTLIDVLSSISSLIISFFIVVMYNQFYALVVLVFGVPYFCITIQSAKKTHEFHMTFVNSERKKDYLFRTALNPLHTINIKLFNIISFMRNKYFEISEFILDLKKNFIKKMNFKLMSFELMPELAVLLISFSILVKVFRGESGIGDYTFYSSILAQVSSSLGISAIYLMQLHDDQLKINIVRDIIRYTPQITDSGISILTRIYEIEFDDVSFRYPGTDRMILHNISFRIDRKIYLIGKNGSGKSTITKLLLRLYEPTSGRILINGKDISEYTIASVRDAFSVYIQNSSCYAFTLYENIVFKDTTNNTDNLRGEVFSFLEHVIPSSLTNKIPYGLDTHLSREFDSEGVQLSVGEMQIIALARVLFKKNSFFILDEPSSSLDPDIEDKIYNQIEDILSDNPAIIITHRLSNIKSEDVIILVDDGVICGHNTHKNLMTSNSLYKELYEYQMNQYIVVEQNSSC